LFVPLQEINFGIMNNMVNVSLNVPQSDVNFLNKLVEKMGWGMTQSQAKASSPTDKVELAKRLYGCIQLPEDFDYKEELTIALYEKYRV